MTDMTQDERLSAHSYRLAQQHLDTVDPVPPAPTPSPCELGGTQDITKESAGPPRVIDAYQYPRKVRPGCQHQLGCGCDPPYWLRVSSPQEQAHEAKIYSVPTVYPERP